MRLLDAVSAALDTAGPYVATRDALAAGADFTWPLPGWCGRC
jgi:hypothetical protein